MDTIKLDQTFDVALCSDVLLEWPKYKQFNPPEEVIGKYCIYNGFLYYVSPEDQQYYITPYIEEAQAFLEQNGYIENNFFMFPPNHSNQPLNISSIDVASSTGHKFITERDRLQKTRILKDLVAAKGVIPLQPMEYDQTVEIDRFGIDVHLENDRQRIFLSPYNESNIKNNVGTYNISMNGTLSFVNEEGRTFITPVWDYYLVLLDSLGYTFNPGLLIPEKIAVQGYIPTSGLTEVDPISQKWNGWKADCIQRSHTQNEIYLRACTIYNSLTEVTQNSSNASR